jgi:hypothetical protein
LLFVYFFGLHDSYIIVLFNRWVVEQSKQDQELLFFDSLLTTLDENNNRMFNKLKFAGEKLLLAGEKYQLPLSERSDHVTAVLVEGFVPDAMLYYNSVSS